MYVFASLGISLPTTRVTFFGVSASSSWEWYVVEYSPGAVSFNSSAGVANSIASSSTTVGTVPVTCSSDPSLVIAYAMAIGGPIAPGAPFSAVSTANNDIFANAIVSAPSVTASFTTAAPTNLGLMVVSFEIGSFVSSNVVGPTFLRGNVVMKSNIVISANLTVNGTLTVRSAISVAAGASIFVSESLILSIGASFTPILTSNLLPGGVVNVLIATFVSKCVRSSNYQSSADWIFHPALCNVGNSCG
jgi:hypothetical protein